MSTGTLPCAVGDWVFHDFELSQITAMEDGRVTGVTTDVISSCSHDMACVPLTRRQLLLANECRHAYRELHQRAGLLDLNYPDLHREYVQRWYAAAQLPETTPLDEALHPLREFTAQLLARVDQLHAETHAGVRLLRR